MATSLRAKQKRRRMACASATLEIPATSYWSEESGARHHDRQPDRGAHENDRRPGRQSGQQVGRATRAKRRLRTLSAKGAGKISRLALLQQYHTDEEQTDHNVHNDEKNEHGWSKTFLAAEAAEDGGFGAEEGT
jgi:hypothetical protein